MKHSILSTVLLVGIGLAPALGFLGGGNMYYPPTAANAQSQQSADDIDQTPTIKGNAAIPARQETAENQRAASCAGIGENSCAGRSAQPAK